MTEQEKERAATFRPDFSQTTKTMREIEIEKELHTAEELIIDCYKHCRCQRFETKGFDYGEEHGLLGKPGVGKRWLTPRDLIDAWRVKKKPKAYIKKNEPF